MKILFTHLAFISLILLILSASWYLGEIFLLFIVLSMKLFTPYSCVIYHVLYELNKDVRMKRGD